MPFKSRSQQRACFATNGFNGKVDCKEWAGETNFKNLPESKKRGKQRGGVSRVAVSPLQNVIPRTPKPNYNFPTRLSTPLNASDTTWYNQAFDFAKNNPDHIFNMKYTTPAVGNFMDAKTDADKDYWLWLSGMMANAIDDVRTQQTTPLMVNPSTQAKWFNKKKNRFQTGGVLPPMTNEMTSEELQQATPAVSEVYKDPNATDPLQEAIDKGLILAPEGFRDSQEAYDFYRFRGKKRRGLTVNPMDMYLGMKATANALSFVSGSVERGRQNRYMMDQMANLNQTNPIPVSNFQPTPYNLYAKKGGKFRNIGRY